MNAKEPKQLPVLVIEDDPELRRTLRRQLESEGFEVVVASDGSEGLRLLRGTDFAAVVSDHYMPGMSGVDVLRIARWFRPGAARVLTTSSDEVGVMVRAVNEADVHAIVQKPWPQAGLGELVRNALERHAQQKKGHRAAEPDAPRTLAGAPRSPAPASPWDQVTAVAPRPPLPKAELVVIPRKQPPRPPPARIAKTIEAPAPVVVAELAPPTPVAVAAPVAAPVPSPAAEALPLILAVDDDPRWARCVDRALRAEGYAVHTATSGSMALEAMAKTDYAMVLLDMNMPKESGIDFARRVRRGQGGDRHRDVPIVFLTSDMTSDSYEASFEVGALRYVQKSSDANELIGVVQSVMHGA